jgi:hypothetical protein
MDAADVFAKVSLKSAAWRRSRRAGRLVPLSGFKVDIVDCQVHANKYHSTAAAPELALEALVGAMDALGIAGVVIDAFTHRDEVGKMYPGGYDGRGSWVPRRPFSRLACERYPERFRYLCRLEVQDPHLAELMASLRSDHPGVVGLRLISGPKRVVWSDPLFQGGGYSRYFELAEKHRLPIFLAIAPASPSACALCEAFSRSQLHHRSHWVGVRRRAPSF